jgi:hypothetical protein
MEGDDQDGASRLISYEHHDKYRISSHLRDQPPRKYDDTPIIKDVERTTSLTRPVIDVNAIVSTITIKEVLFSIITVMDIHTMICE